MQRLSRSWNTTIVQKWIMAITGIGLVLFLLAHLSGNLLIFLGPDHMNAYGVELRELLHGSAIWALRGGLVVMFVLHVASGIRLSAINRHASGGKNERVTHVASSVASRTMIYTGLLVAIYLLYHLAHFTWGIAHAEYSHYTDSLGRHDVYRMVVESFRQPMITLTYVLAMIVTALHLNHAISSAFQTLGINHPRYTPLIRMVGPLLGIIIAIGFLSIPVSIFLGIVQ